MKLLQLLLHFIFNLFPKDLKALLDAFLGHDGLICDGIGWWNRFNKGSDGGNGIYIGHVDIVESTDTNNQVDPSHGALIGSFIILFDVGRIP